MLTYPDVSRRILTYADEGGDSASGLVKEVIGLQRSVPFPLFVCPLHVLWSRAPLEATGGGGVGGGGGAGGGGSAPSPVKSQNQMAHKIVASSSSLERTSSGSSARGSSEACGKQIASTTEWLFGTRRRPGVLRTAVSMLCNRRRYLHTLTAP